MRANIIATEFGKVDFAESIRYANYRQRLSLKSAAPISGAARRFGPRVQETEDCDCTPCVRLRSINPK
jgi:hypothetical protein